MSDVKEIRTTVKGYSGEKFINSFEDICDNISKKYAILTFAIIIYDESNPEYRKIFRDTDYWDALDKASGDKLLVFTLGDSIKQEYEPSYEIRMITDFMPSASNKTKSYSSLIKKVFNDEALLVYPSVIFFQIKDKEISNYRLIPISRNTEWKSCYALQDLFSSISDVLNRIEPQNYNNKDEIFSLVKDELLRQKYTMYIMKGPKILSNLIGTIKSLMGM